jgi:hypothetical protein
VWIGAIFVPLCFLGNKQIHYLTSLMPPLMILSGWWLDSVLLAARAGDAKQQRIPLLDATFLLGILGIPGILVAGHITRGSITSFDAGLAVALTVGLAVVGYVYVRHGVSAATLAYMVIAVFLFVPAIGIWVPQSETGNSRQVARELRSRFGDGPYCYYGPAFSLPLCFNLRTKIPSAAGPAELENVAASMPGVVVIAQTKSKYAPPPPPPGFIQQPPDIDVPGQSFRIYRQR